jgi:hypothetical protein
VLWSVKMVSKVFIGAEELQAGEAEEDEVMVEGN